MFPTQIGWKFYLVFLIALTCFIIPLFFYFPETKGLSLEEIARLFNDETTTVRLDAPDTAEERKDIEREKDMATQAEMVDTRA